MTSRYMNGSRFELHAQVLAAPEGTEGGEAKAAVGEEGAGATSTPAASAQDWRDKRIAQLTAKSRELERTLQSVRTEVKPPVGADGKPLPEKTFTESQVRQMTEQAQAAAAFNLACNEAATDGVTRFGQDEFLAAISEIGKLYDKTDPKQQAAYNEFLADALESDDPAQVLFDLGKDINEADRITNLPRPKRIAELAKRGVKAKGDSVAEQAVKAAKILPKPITPVGGRGAALTEIAPDDPARGMTLSTAEWMKRRNADVAAARKEGYRGRRIQ